MKSIQCSCPGYYIAMQAPPILPFGIHINFVRTTARHYDRTGIISGPLELYISHGGGVIMACACAPLTVSQQPQNKPGSWHVEVEEARVVLDAVNVGLVPGPGAGVVSQQPQNQPGVAHDVVEPEADVDVIEAHEELMLCAGIVVVVVIVVVTESKHWPNHPYLRGLS